MSLAAPVPRSWLRWFAVWKWTFGKWSIRRSICLFGVVVLLGLVTYGGFYWLSLGYKKIIKVDHLAGTRRTRVRPLYASRFQLPPSFTPFIRLFFKPAHQIDCWIRHDLWSPQVEILMPEEREKYLARHNEREIARIRARTGQVVGSKLE